MRPLRYSINVSLDGCCDHRAMLPDPQLHQHAADTLARADALLLGRVTYLMMEEAWRAGSSVADEMPEWTAPFARTIDTAQKYVVSSTLQAVDWNAELIRGDLREAVQDLKAQPGDGLYVGGVQLPLALAQWGLIDEYEFIVHPVVVGEGRRLFAGLAERLELRLVGRQEFEVGAVGLRYVPARAGG